MSPSKTKSFVLLLLLFTQVWTLSGCGGKNDFPPRPTDTPAAAAPTAAPVLTQAPATPVPTVAAKPTEANSTGAVAKGTGEDEFDARSLPKFADAEVIYEDKALLIYVTPADVVTVVDFTRQELTALGWQEFIQANTSQEDDPTLETMTFLKDGQELSVFITVAPAQGNKTSVQYSFPTLTTQIEAAPTTELIPTEESIIVEIEPTEASSTEMPDLPIPTDAQGVSYDADLGEITFTIPTEIKKVVEFYRQELKKKDWVEDEIVSLIEDTFGSLEFTKGEASLSFTLFRLGEDTEVTISIDGLSAAAEPSTDDTGVTTTEGSTPEESNEPLVAEDKDGLPVPNNYENFSDENSPYRRSLYATSPSPVKALFEFYQRELSARGWLALPSTLGATDTEATQLYENPDGQLDLRLTKNDSGGTDINLTVKMVAAAKKDGILPPSGQVRIYFGNFTDGQIIFNINQKEIKVEVQDPGQNSMKGVPFVDLPPGEHAFTLTLPGQAPIEDKLKVGSDETWALAGGPGGALPLQMY